MVIKKLLCLFFVFSCSIPSLTAAAIDTTVIRNLTHDWYFYNSGNDSYLPLVNRADFDGTTIHFDIQTGEYSNSQLRIFSRQPVSLFINNKMTGIIKGEKYFDMDSLSRSVTEEELHFTIYSKVLNPFNISAEIVSVGKAELKALDEDAVVIRERSSDPFQNFALVAVLVVAAFLAALFNYFPRNVFDFYKASRAFALRESDENLFKSRPISRINLLFYIYLSLLIALVLMLLANRLDVRIEVGMLYPDGFLDGLWKWIQLTGVVMCWIFAKYLLIYNLSALFYLRSFVISHFFNYVRMTLFIFTVALVITIISYYGFEILSPGYYESLFIGILVFLGISILIRFFKLLNTASYKTLHLFSYLCGTELIPFVILLYLGIHQPF